MIEQGTVRELADAGRTARVEVRVSGRCSSCGNRPSCAGDDKEVGVLVTLDSHNPAGARPGDRVRIEMNPENVWISTLMVFALPVVGVMAGYLLGHLVGPIPGPGPYVGAAAGLVAWIILMLVVGRAVKRRRAFRPTVVQIVSRPTPSEDAPK